MKARYITSKQMVDQFSLLKTSDEWKRMNLVQRIEAEFTHEMMLKNQVNREIYEQKFGMYFEDAVITDEEIAETEMLEDEIRLNVVTEMEKFYGKNYTVKYRKSQKQGNLDFLFWLDVEMILRKVYIQTQLMEASQKGELQECLKKLENLINIKDDWEIKKEEKENGKD